MRYNVYRVYRCKCGKPAVARGSIGEKEGGFVYGSFCSTHFAMYERQHNEWLNENMEDTNVLNMTHVKGYRPFHEWYNDKSHYSDSETQQRALF